MFMVDKIFNVFPVYETRFGIKSEQLFYAHPTFCAAALYYLLLLFILFGNLKKRNEKIYIAILLFLICSTLRFKAIATCVLFVAIYIYFVILKNKKLHWSIVLLGVVSIGIICYDQISFYFLSAKAVKMPRGAMLFTSLKIAKDYFPFGTGFGTFGSFYSGQNYSDVYQLYNINTIYGMTQDNYTAISDNYWPMVLGQSGVLGLIFMGKICWSLYKLIGRYQEISINQYIAALGACIYVLISSTSESAFTNPVCIPLAFVLGMVFSQKKEVDIQK